MRNGFYQDSVVALSEMHEDSSWAVAEMCLVWDAMATMLRPQLCSRRIAKWIQVYAETLSRPFHCGTMEPGSLTDVDIRKGYRAAARRLHPDRGGKSEEFQELFGS